MMSREGSRAPDFFLIGVPRAATTSLYYGLRQHPGIFAPDLKEACFTCPDLDPGTRRVQTRWIYDRDEYLDLFRAARPDQLIGEGCMYNVYSPAAPAMIRALSPGAKLLVQLRDPVEQLRSNHALKIIMLDTEHEDLGEAIAVQDDAQRDRKEPPVNMRDYGLRDKATVGPGLARFIAEFGRDRVHMSLYEDFASDPASVFRSIFAFLGLDVPFAPGVEVMVPNRRSRSRRLNKVMGSVDVVERAKRLVPARLHPAARRLAMMGFRLNRRRATRDPIDSELLARLREDFRPEVELLSDLTGRNLVERWWGDSARADETGIAAGHLTHDLPAPSP
jgi:hypothetical protein